MAEDPNTGHGFLTPDAAIKRNEDSLYSVGFGFNGAVVGQEPSVDSFEDVQRVSLLQSRNGGGKFNLARPGGSPYKSINIVDNQA